MYPGTLEYVPRYPQSMHAVTPRVCTRVFADYVPRYPKSMYPGNPRICILLKKNSECSKVGTRAGERKPQHPSMHSIHFLLCSPPWYYTTRKTSTLPEFPISCVPDTLSPRLSSPVVRLELLFAQKRHKNVCTRRSVERRALRDLCRLLGDADHRPPRHLPTGTVARPFEALLHAPCPRHPSPTQCMKLMFHLDLPLTPTPKTAFSETPPRRRNFTW